MGQGPASRRKTFVKEYFNTNHKTQLAANRDAERRIM